MEGWCFVHIQTIPILLILFFQLLSPAGHYGELISEDQADAVTSRLKLTVTEKEPAKEGILCFDVDEDARIALGTKSHGRNWISIYDSNMVFQYAISFRSEGSFLVFLDGVRRIRHSCGNDTGRIAGALFPGELHYPDEQHLL